MDKNVSSKEGTERVIITSVFESLRHIVTIQPHSPQQHLMTWKNSQLKFLSNSVILQQIHVLMLTSS